jgi:hypothetical protein
MGPTANQVADIIVVNERVAQQHHRRADLAIFEGIFDSNESNFSPSVRACARSVTN